MSSNKVFAPVIFFIAAREALEASLVMGTLEGMLEQLVGHSSTKNGDDSQVLDAGEEQRRRATIRRMRKIVLSGAFAGLFVAFCIGAAFLAVFYTQVNDLFAKAEELWEGIFNLIAVVLITPMALAILRASKSKAKWQQKLALAFNNTNPTTTDSNTTTLRPETPEKDVEEGTSSPKQEIHQVADVPHLEVGASEKTPASEHGSVVPPILEAASPAPKQKKHSWLSSFNLFSRFNRGSLTLFMIPFITTLREGLEGVVFIGGVSLSLPATSIPLPAIVGIIVGLAIGFAIFKCGNVLGVRMFLLFSTGFLLILSAGMASRAVYFLQFHSYVALVGEGAAESGSGPGSYNANGYIWHFDCCNPEIKTGSGQGWGVLNSLVGWNNTATYGSIFMYVGYWIAVSTYLWYCIWKEGRLRLSWRGRTVWESARARRMSKAKQASVVSAQ